MNLQREDGVAKMGKKRLTAAVIITVSLALAWTAFGQTGLRSNDGDDELVFRTETDLVSLDVTVTDRKGRPVGDLTKEDFIVYENGKQQEIAFFSHEQRPASWGLVLDRSGSMSSMIEDVYKAALHSVESGTPEDEIFIMTFDVIPELVQPFTSDRRELLRSISRLWAGGGTALYDAGAFAIDYARDAKHRKRVLVIVTDGEDNASTISFKNFLKMAQRSETIIYTVGLFDPMDTISYRTNLFGSNGFLGFGVSNPRKQLERLAEETGGMAYFPKNMEECIRAHRDIARQVSRQYSLAYYLRNTHPNGGRRQIKVEVLRAGNLIVHSRKNYFPPEPERNE